MNHKLWSSLFLLALAAHPPELLHAQRTGNRDTPRRSDRRSSDGPERTRVPFRSIDGSGNNLRNPDWGSVGASLFRVARSAYADGTDAPSGPGRPNPRAISNALCAQTVSVPNALGASDMVWQWGQFLDHDLDLSPVASPEEPFDIAVPSGDPYFDPAATGVQVIPLDRTVYVYDASGVRQQTNAISAFLDASNVYGSDDERAQALRALDGSGCLAVSPGGLLPYNVHGLENDPTAHDPSFFLAGDVRANEQVGLLAMHTLWVREHNSWATVFGLLMPGSDGDLRYEMARRIVGAEMQAITYREFLPVLLGPDALAPYRGYRANVKPDIANAFSAASYRFGHSMLSPSFQLLDASGHAVLDGSLALRDAFFQPSLVERLGIDPILRGLATQRAQEGDTLLIDEVRNFLFGPPGSGGFDLASLNLQRGRDHGLPSYNRVRRDYGLAPRDFDEITSDPELAQSLRDTYGSTRRIDPWLGGLAEDPLPGALVGELIQAVLKDQFERLRDGDRYWYQNVLPPELQAFVERQSLATVIRRNTGIGSELQDDVFHVPGS